MKNVVVSLTRPEYEVH